jgi:amidophosphoribosyltransferase
MSGIVAFSVNPNIYYKPESDRAEEDRQFIDDLFLLTFYRQHLGVEYSGMATVTMNPMNGDKKIQLRTHRGLFRPKFEDDLVGFYGPLGLTHISDNAREPYQTESAFSTFCICFAGNVINRDEIISELKKKNQSLERVDDVVLIAKLIIEAGWDESKSVNDNFLHGLQYMTDTIEGAYALAILTESKIFAARGPDGHEILSIGKKKGAAVIASETTGFLNQDFEVDRDLGAGEVVVLSNGEVTTIGTLSKEGIKAQFDSFKKVYTEFPTSMTMGVSSAEVRIRMGASLARRDIENGFYPDVVSPIPDSGRFHAIGYHMEFIRQVKEGLLDPKHLPVYVELLIKYPYSSRSYIPAFGVLRDYEARLKIIPLIDGQYVGKIGVFVDDSIVRGTQSRNNLIPKIRAIGLKEIHLRIANPKLVNTCRFTKSNKKKKELGAYNAQNNSIRSDKEMAEMLGIDSCQYNECADVALAIGQPVEELCVECSVLEELN